MQHTSRFILVGLCSGADHAVLYSRTDPRVAGLVLMDPTMPPTARYYFHYVVQRLGRLGSWLSVAAGRSGLMRLLLAHLKHRVRPQGALEGLTLQNLKFSPYLAECYRTAAERGIEMLSVFTSVSARQTYRDQILDAFPKIAAHEALRLEFFEDSDHVFSADKDRASLVTLIADWLGPGGADEPAARP
jgi:pimeloyl-ACP methyl ester carboxylesterase